MRPAAWPSQTDNSKRSNLTSVVKRNGRARGLDRAVAILEHLGDCRRPLRPNEIAVAMGAPKSSIYEIINNLLEHRILEYFDKEGRVFLGRKLHFLGTAYLANFDLTREAQSYLDAVTGETRETSQLCMLSGNKYTVVLMKEGIRSFRISSDVGKPTPLPWTASGRLLVAHLSDAEIRSLIPAADFILPDGSQLDPSKFIAEAREAQADGFFSFDSVANNFTHCFAAPVYNEHGICAATLCIIAPADDAQRNYVRYRQILEQNASDLSAKLSGNVARLANAATD